ncbi:MAG: trans-aconitate 2-methyltransferase [Lysobacterales bacterium]
MSNLLVKAFRHLFLDRSYTHYYSKDQWEAMYEEGYELNKPQEDGRYGVLTQLLSRHVGAEPVLDVGCGEGLVATHLRRVSDVPLEGFDLSEKAIAIARSRNIPDCQYSAAGFDDVNPGEQRYSVIVFNESLYYADDPALLVRKYQQWLAPKGVFLISMYDTVVTRRVWRSIANEGSVKQAVQVKDLESQLMWTLKILAPERQEN